MSYTAKINGEIFFKTNSDDRKLGLSEASLHLKAGAAGTFDFTVTTENKKYGLFRKNIDFIDVYRNDEVIPIFSGRIGESDKDFYLSDSITSEGALSYLGDTIFRPITYQGYLHGLLRTLIDNHNGQVEESKRIFIGNILVQDQAVYREYQNYETTISRLQDLVDSFGGYLRARKTVEGLLYLDWYNDFIDGTNQKIEIGENLIDLNITESIDDVYTMLIPLGADDGEGNPITIKSVNAGLDYILAPQEYINKYGYVVGVQRWDDVEIPANLKRKAEVWMSENLEPKVTINVTAADLADAGYDIDNFNIGQKILVNSPAHGIENIWFSCCEQTLDLLNPANNTLTLGEEKIGYVGSRSNSVYDTIIERIATKYATTAEMNLAINNATQAITGNSGDSHVILHDKDGDGKPDELLIMDTDDIETAQKVWRLNGSGFGYSSTGYNGTYGLAMTMDGAIVADYITTGILNANLLRAGIIRGQQGNTYWDLNTGIFHLEGSGDGEYSKVFPYQPTPPYFVGDLWITERAETSAVVGYAIAGYSIVDDDSDGEGGKIMMCIYTRTDGSFDAADWTSVTNYVDDSDLQILQQRVSSVEFDVDSLRGEITSKASSEEINTLGERVSYNETQINQNAYAITLKVSQEDYTGDAIISRINLTASDALIAAEKINLSGAVTFTSFDASTKSSILTNSTSKNQYYLSTSSTSLSGGSWSDKVRWSSGRYVWTRIALTKTYADGTSTTSYSDPIYDENITSANANSSTALGSTVSVYYRSTSSATPSINTSTSIGTSDNTDNVWTYVLPRPKYGAYFHTCERYTQKDGTVTFSAVRSMTNVTYTSLWCSANDAAYIDGQHIYAGTVTTNQLAANAVTAAKINVTDLFSKSITATNFTITGGAININSNSSTTKVIRLGYGNGINTYYAPEQLWFENTNSPIKCEVGLKAWQLYLNSHDHDGGIGVYTSGTYNRYLYLDANYVHCTKVTESSDRRLKTNIKTISEQEACQFVYNLNPVVYERHDLLGFKSHGFIAQEVDEIKGDAAWDIISEDNQGYLGIDYTSIIPDIVATIQSLNRRLTEIGG